MTDYFGAVPAAGQPWPEGRSLSPSHIAPWLVLRHGGRRTDSWNPLWCADDEQDGRKRYEDVRESMRQGGVVLVDPAGVVRARSWAPRLRTRW